MTTIAIVIQMMDTIIIPHVENLTVVAIKDVTVEKRIVNIKIDKVDPGLLLMADVSHLLVVDASLPLIIDANHLLIIGVNHLLMADASLLLIIDVNHLLIIDASLPLIIDASLLLIIGASLLLIIGASLPLVSDVALKRKNAHALYVNKSKSMSSVLEVYKANQDHVALLVTKALLVLRA